MSGDGLFPLPEPEFLFIHQIYFPSFSKETDSRGMVTTNLVTDPLPAPVRAYVTSPDPSASDSGYAKHVQVDAIALTPREFDVSLYGYCYVPPQQDLLYLLSGVYTINTPRPNLSHTRIMLTKNAEPWAEEFEGVLGV